MKAYLFVDFGSTNTKLTLIDIEKEEIIATSKAYTTVETNVMNGYEEAYEKLMNQVDEDVDIIKKTACSSAAGGLKMIAIGLVDELTAEAAKRAALGAGARVLHTYCGNLNRREAKEIAESNLDIILLAGGTDGGNVDCITHNAMMLANAEVKVPVVVAGNKSALDDIDDIFDGKVEYYVAENVMPKLNVINVESSRELIRKIFMKNITKARGMTHVQEDISAIIMPTPAAVLKAAEVLSKGTKNEEGMGELAVIDIGGATTDIHSLTKGLPTRSSVLLRGLQEPYAKRTVEGDLGMRRSIRSVVEGASPKMLADYLGENYEYDVEGEAKFRFENSDFIARTERDLNYDVAMAKICTRLSMKRHAGRLEETYSPMGPVQQQWGKDLSNLKTIIGTGGVLVYTDHAAEILSAAIYNMEDPESLEPVHPDFYLDSRYILSAMGLLCMIDPDMAVRLMKKYIIKVEGAHETTEQEDPRGRLHEGAPGGAGFMAYGQGCGFAGGCGFPQENPGGEKLRGSDEES